MSKRLSFLNSFFEINSYLLNGGTPSKQRKKVGYELINWFPSSSPASCTVTCTDWSVASYCSSSPADPCCWLLGEVVTGLDLMSPIRRDGIKWAGAMTPEQEGGNQGTEYYNAAENVKRKWPIRAEVVQMIIASWFSDLRKVRPAPRSYKLVFLTVQDWTGQTSFEPGLLHLSFFFQVLNLWKHQNAGLTINYFCSLSTKVSWKEAEVVS